jgi:chemotaxis protein CheY-P-specific phosphatase CheC
MGKNSQTVIDEVFCKVLEKQAFLFPDKTPADELPPQSGNMLYAHISFSGAPANGEIKFYAPEVMCQEIAANFLGIEADSPEAASKALDSLMEMLNMVCGNFLTDFAGEEAVFDLTVPSAAPISKEEWSAVLSRPDALCYCADDYAIVCVLAMKE